MLSITIHVLPLILASALAMQAGFYHLTVYKRRRSVADGYFVACCFSLAVYAACFSAQLCITDAAAAVASQRAQLLAVNLFGPSLLWFIHAYTGSRSNLFARLLTAAYGLVFLVSVVGPRAWLTSDHVEQALNVMPWAAAISYLEPPKGPLADIQMLLHIVGIPYVTGLCGLYVWRRRNVQSAALLLAALVVCVAAVNDIAAFEGLITSMYATIYAFLFLVLFMGNVLVWDVAEAARAQDALRRRTERLQLAQEGGRLIFWDWMVPEQLVYVSRPGGPWDSQGMAREVWRREQLLAAVAEEDLPAVRRAVDVCFTPGAERFGVEARVSQGGEAPRWTLLQGQVFERDPAGAPLRISGTAVDTDDLRRYQQALRESEARTHAVLAGVSDFVFILALDDKGLVRWAQGAWLRELAPATAEGSPWPLRCLEPSVTPESLVARFERARREGSLSYRTHYKVGQRDSVPVEVRATPLQWSGDDLLLLSARDISEHRLSEQRQQEVAEAERQILGQEIHDGIGQFLTALSYRVRNMMKDAEKDKYPHMPEVARIGELVQLIGSELRLFSRSLYASALLTEGLEAAVRDLVLFYQQHFDAACTLDWSGAQPDLDRANQLNVYRLLQEALTNAFKHGEARRTHVTVRFTEVVGHLEVTNDGKPWGTTSNRGSGVGLQNMRRRALLLGGELTIETPPDGGARVICTFPLRRNA